MANQTKITKQTVAIKIQNEMKAIDRWIADEVDYLCHERSKIQNESDYQSYFVKECKAKQKIERLELERDEKEIIFCALTALNCG